MEYQIDYRFMIQQSPKGLLSWTENIVEGGPHSQHFKLLYGPAIVRDGMLYLEPEEVRDPSSLDEYREWHDRIKTLPTWDGTRHFCFPYKNEQGKREVHDLSTSQRARGKEDFDEKAVQDAVTLERAAGNKFQIQKQFMIIQSPNGQLRWREGRTRQQYEQPSGICLIDGDVLRFHEMDSCPRMGRGLDKNFDKEVKVLPLWDGTKYYCLSEKNDRGEYPVYNVKTLKRVRSKETSC